MNFLYNGVRMDEDDDDVFAAALHWLIHDVVLYYYCKCIDGDGDDDETRYSFAFSSIHYTVQMSVKKLSFN